MPTVNRPAVPAKRGTTVTLVDARTERQRRKALVELRMHQVDTAVRREMAIMDNEMIADVVASATDEMLRFAADYIPRAANSHTAAQVVANKLRLLDSLIEREVRRNLR